MRKEDRIYLPPRRVFKLPPGYYVKRTPGGYSLYHSVEVIPGGISHRLVCTKGAAEADQIEAAAVRDLETRDAIAKGNRGS